MFLKKNSTKIPLNVLNEMKDRGAIVEKLQGEDLYSVTELVYGDEAWKVYQDWGNTIDADPRVGAVFAPSENILGSVLRPDDIIAIRIQREDIARNIMCKRSVPFATEQVLQSILFFVRNHGWHRSSSEGPNFATACILVPKHSQPFISF